MLPGIVDVTRITGAKVVGSPTSWQTPNGPYNVEHVGATGPANELLTFWWSPQHDWQVVNITAKTGQPVTGGVTSWQTHNGPYLVEHLAGRSPAGDLITSWWSPQHDWQALNVSARTGRRIAGAPASWVTPDGAGGTVEHLAARGINGELLVFFWTPASDWQVVDVTAKTGRGVAGDVTAWQSTNGPMIVEHVAGVSADGTLSVFWWSPAHDWQALNVSSIAGGVVNGRAVSWVANSVEHVGVHGRNNELFVYWWTPATNWRLVDVSAITGQPIAEVSAAYQLSETGANVELLSARGIDNALLRFWWRPDRDWQAQNLTLAAGASVSSGTAAWLTPSGSALVEHAAAATPQQSLTVVWDDGESRRLTDATGAPLAPMSRRQGRPKIVAILWDPKRETDPAPAVPAVEDTVFGAVNSARDYYLQVSGNAFTFERAGLFGWFPASRPASYWWGPPDTNDSDHDGWVNPHVQKWTEAIRDADPQFNFGAFDVNPHDGHLRPEDELGVLIVIPQNGPFGSNRSVVSREYPNPMPLVVDGTTIPVIAEVYIGAPPNRGVVAHELGHLLANLPDLYFALPNDPQWNGIPFDNPFAAGDYCLMDNTYNGAHFCPFLRLKLGWLRPRLVCRSGRYQLQAIESGREVLVLLHPSRGTREYFIIENRFKDGSYDSALPDRGLGIWHVIEDPATYGSFIPPTPPNPPASSRQDLWQAKWATIAKNDWGRRGIRMIRPVWDTFRPAQSLWDGSDPATGYDLLPDAPPPRASLRWADGTPSGFAVRNISAAGAVMTADLTVPW
jgi:M6 family metalloprotease-like protein